MSDTNLNLRSVYQIKTVIKFRFIFCCKLTCALPYSVLCSLAIEFWDPTVEIWHCKLYYVVDVAAREVGGELSTYKHWPGTGTALNYLQLLNLKRTRHGADDSRATLKWWRSLPIVLIKCIAGRIFNNIMMTVEIRLSVECLLHFGGGINQRPQ